MIGLAERGTHPKNVIGRITMTGDPELAQACATRLNLDWRSIESLCIESHCELLVYIGVWNPELEKRINRQCHTAKRPWLRVRLEGMYAEIGPLTLPYEAGCLECAEVRRYRASDFPDGWRALQKNIEDHNQNLPNVLTNAARTMLFEIISEELETWSINPKSSRTHHGVLRLNLEDLRLQHHRFQPDSHCETCGERAEDTRLAANLVLQSQPKPFGALRLRNLKSEKISLLEQYVDGHLGMVNRLVKHTGNLYANASASTLYPHNTEPDRGFGRGVDFQASQLAALMEALERYGGMRPNSKQTSVRGSHRTLEHHALDPSSLGLHDEEQYNMPNFPFQPYSPEAEIDWVWGYSFLKRQPILIPEGIAYYGLPMRRPGFAYECSNGCALGGSLEEAILYGILEVVERDSFLIAWYAKLELPEIDLKTVRDTVLRLQIERLEHQSGFVLRAFNATMEQGIPTVWLMAVAPSPQVEEPSVLCAAGSHLGFERAIANAIGELAPNAGFFREHYLKNLDHITQMTADPNLCIRLEDHQLLYAHLSMRSKLGFLLNSEQKHPLNEIESSITAPVGFTDLRDDLEHLMQRFLKDGHDIIVVDQTAPEHKKLGFHCVKVIIPGFMPMTFGHKYRRTQNLPRLLEVPYRMGYRARPLEVGDLQTEPHPFP
jgi:ribosomal protein S12 methylthiotransferase accessory factor